MLHSHDSDGVVGPHLKQEVGCCTSKKQGLGSTLITMEATTDRRRTDKTIIEELLIDDESSTKISGIYLELEQIKLRFISTDGDFNYIDKYIKRKKII